MGLDRFPKKPCKYCKKTGHFPYQCLSNPKVIARQKTGLKRTPIKKVGKRTQQWFDARTKWIEDNPPPIENTYWQCYLQIHPWCPVRIDVKHLTLDHVISRSSDPSLRLDPNNLRPACEYCNNMKGSRTLEQVNRDTYNNFVQHDKRNI